MPDICHECHSTVTPNYRGACVTCLRREIDRLRLPASTPMPDLYEIPDLEFEPRKGVFVAATEFGWYYVWPAEDVVEWQFEETGINTADSLEAAIAAANAHWRSRMASALRPVKLTMRIDNLSPPTATILIDGEDQTTP